MPHLFFNGLLCGQRRVVKISDILFAVELHGVWSLDTTLGTYRPPYPGWHWQHDLVRQNSDRSAYAVTSGANMRCSSSHGMGMSA
jgi:hypothetical protein